MMQQVPITLHGLPIQAVLISNGQIGFVKMGMFPTIFDWNNETIISQENIIVKGETFLYNHGYRASENLKDWLKSLMIDNPFEGN